MKNVTLSLLMLIFLPFASISQNTWQTKSTFMGGKRAGSEVFGIGSFGYLFGGIDSFAQPHNDLWLYDPLADQWNQRASMPGPARFSAVNCVIGSKVYIGTGFDNSTYYNDWWEYNPATNSWSQKTDFPGAVRSTAVALTINDKGYVGMGKGMTWYGDWYEYNPGNNTWSSKANYAGGPGQNGVAFGIGNYGYVGLGSINNSYSVNTMYRYDPSSNAWSAVSPYPLSTGAYAVGYFTIGNKAFVCGGYDYTNLHDESYEYDPVADNWTPIASFTNVSPPRYFRGGFAANGKGYLVGGSVNASLGTSGYRNDLIEYTSNYVGINEIEVSNVAVYYQQNSSELILKSENAIHECFVQIYSCTGSFIQSVKINDAGRSQPLLLAHGIYYYFLDNEKKHMKEGKFIVL